MIKIKRFENVYGIKKLVSPELIEGNTVIYAPNGVMKTSFSDGLDAISKGEKPYDVFFDKPAKYEIDDNGRTITESSTETSLNVLVFSDDYFKRDVFTDPEISRLVMSTELREEYDKKMKSLQDVEKQLNELISFKVLGKKKASEDGIDFFQSVFGGENFFEVVQAIPSDEFSYLYEEECKKIDYQNIFNDKTFEILNDEQFKEKCQTFLDIKKKKLDEKIFNNGFGFDELAHVFDTLKAKKYFNANHKLNMGGENYDKKRLEELIKNIENEIYGSTEVIKIYQDAKKVLDKNKNTRNLVSVIENNKWVLGELIDSKKFQKNLVLSKISEDLNKIKLLQDKILTVQKEIDNILKKAEKFKGLWENVINKFNTRFYNKYYELQIDELPNAVLGLVEPKFVKKIKGTGKIFNEELKTRLSSGEKRSILILNLLFEIELFILRGKNFTLVLDDIADSFDYKNKYAIIEYLKDLSNIISVNIQLIILTHNFDFYRSVRLSIPDNLSKLLAYNVGENVQLFDAKSQLFENYCFFNEWKNKSEIACMIALIPFLRNVSQLKKNRKDSNYEKLTKFLHYHANIENQKLDELDTIFNEYNIEKCPDYNSKPYIELLDIEAKKIIRERNIKETDLLSKIVLGIFLRIYTDSFLWNKHIEKTGVEPTITSQLNKSRILYNLVKHHLTNEEDEIIQNSFTIAPSFIHINSFMYEPLIDVGSEKLVEAVNNVITINQTVKVEKKAEAYVI